jgi:hypothetical protein
VLRTPDQLAFTTTRNPEVVVSHKGLVPLYQLDEGSFAHIKDENVQMCTEVAVSITFPQTRCGALACEDVGSGLLGEITSFPSIPKKGK